MLPSRLVPLVSPILALTIGCSGDRPVDESAGSESDRRPWAQGPLLEAVLGATSGADAPLSYIDDAAIDSRGYVYIDDLQTKGVIVLNPDLSYNRTVGREGEGPGEFTSVSAIQILPGDSLFAFDGSLDRVSVFAPGSDKPAYVQDLRGEIRHGRVWRFPGSPEYLSWFFPPFMASGSDAGQVRVDILLHVRGEDHGRIDSLFSFPSGDVLVERLHNAEGSAVNVARHPFGARSFVRVLDNSTVVYANSLALEATAIDVDGAVGRLFSHETLPIDVTRAELKSTADLYSRTFAGMLREGAPYKWPPLLGMVVDDSRRVWLGIRKPDRTNVEWAAFSSDGTHVASVDLPAGFMLYAVRGSRLIGAMPDETDLPQFRAYNLQLFESRVASGGIGGPGE